MKYTLLFSLILISGIVFAQNNAVRKIYKFNIKQEIGPAAARQTNQAMDEAHRAKADYIFIEMNTYGGAVDAADSIRTKILHSKIPVLVLIQNNAASAGALISIACDSIYMQAGSTIGAATVVNQTGEQVPDKYQSYMRKKMRATAETNHRNPLIAEAMVDPDISVPGINDTGKVITFTTQEAIKHDFCEKQLESFEEVMKHLNIPKYEVIEYKLTATEKMIGWLINPAVSGILIMIIIGGIYYELQAPGIGFPLLAAATAALLYFAPLYLEGLAANWEILVFIVGVVLLGVELFVIPGFGIFGVAGIAMMVTGLTLSMINNINFDFTNVNSNALLKSFLLVIFSILGSMTLSIYFGSKFLASSLFQKFVLNSTQQSSKGFTSSDTSENKLIGRKGTTATILRPVGKIEIDGEQYDATAMNSFIEKGETVEVVRFETGQLFVTKV